MLGKLTHALRTSVPSPGAVKQTATLAHQSEVALATLHICFSLHSLAFRKGLNKSDLGWPRTTGAWLVLKSHDHVLPEFVTAVKRKSTSC
jgi:hypothetical protein